jgi:NADPH:quinone reductase-like Zn-dependent oxidoreductase
MQALVYQEQHPGKIALEEMPKPTPAKGEVLVRLKAAALNRRDQWMREGLYPGTQSGVILGSDGAGIVEEVADDENAHWLGKEVILNPNINWGPNPQVQGPDYTILGMPVHGTFAEYIAIPSHRLALKPGHLSWEEAAALPLAGLTAYRALMSKGQAQKESKILITGIGGGVATMALLFALDLNAQVYVSSGKDDKIAKAIAMGAKGGFNYRKEGWAKAAKQAASGFDIIIDSAGGDQINDLMKILSPGGRLIFYGATLGISKRLELHKMFWSQVRLEGSTMGNDEEFKAMVTLVERQKLRPLVHASYPLEESPKAFETLKDGQQMGKLVIQIG